MKNYAQSCFVTTLNCSTNSILHPLVTTRDVVFVFALAHFGGFPFILSSIKNLCHHSNRITGVKYSRRICLSKDWGNHKGQARLDFPVTFYYSEKIFVCYLFAYLCFLVKHIAHLCCSVERIAHLGLLVERIIAHLYFLVKRIPHICCNNPLLSWNICTVWDSTADLPLFSCVLSSIFTEFKLHTRAVGLERDFLSSLLIIVPIRIPHQGRNLSLVNEYTFNASSSTALRPMFFQTHQCIRTWKEVFNIRSRLKIWKRGFLTLPWTGILVKQNSDLEGLSVWIQLKRRAKSYQKAAAKFCSVINFWRKSIRHSNFFTELRHGRNHKRKKSPGLMGRTIDETWAPVESNNIIVCWTCCKKCEYSIANFAGAGTN